MAIQTFSSLAAGRDYVIFATGFCSQYAVERFLKARDVGFKVLEGGYTMGDGEVVIETAYIVSKTNFDLHCEGAMLRDQESVLILGHMDSLGRREAVLSYLDNGYEQNDLVWLGRFQEVTETVAVAQRGWSYDPTTKIFYTALPAPIPARWRGKVRYDDKNT